MKILGLNHSIDSGAALLDSGRLVALAEEEKLCGEKHTRRFPSQAIAHCLSQNGIGEAELDAIAYFWNPALSLPHLDTRVKAAARGAWEALFMLPAHFKLPQTGQVMAQTIYNEHLDPLWQAFYLPHHRCHAALAYTLMPNKGTTPTLVMVADGYGEEAATSLYRATPSGLSLLTQTDFPHSLGAVYAAFTEFMGLAANSDEGRVMALAAMGHPRHQEFFEQLIRLNPDRLGVTIDLNYFDYYRPRNQRTTKSLQQKFPTIHHLLRQAGPSPELCDLAASLQHRVEQVTTSILQAALAKWPAEKVALCGGLFLNCALCSHLRQSLPAQSCFVPPAPGDSGSALGAAILLSHLREGRPFDQFEFPSPAPFWGAGTGGMAASCQELDQLGIAYQILDCGPKLAAELLASGEIIGWVNGPGEFGPRALGARSILGPPAPLEIKQKINSLIKGRESYRPLAPAILAKRAPDYFIDPPPSEFMSFTAQVRPDRAAKIPAVLHQNGSARVQIVPESGHPLSELLSHFEQQSGLPLLLNTSYNRAGAAIPTTVRATIETFFGSALKHLFLDQDIYICKK